MVGVVCCLIVIVVAAKPIDGFRRLREGGGGGVETRSAAREGPPSKPEHFRSVDELNKYLADLTEYYTVLGRPRFGKRSDDSVDGETENRRIASGFGRLLRHRRDAVKSTIEHSN